ncbi:hypothetical protein DFR50_11511 [Roseiarcus fermentans]|uniref:Uncharacterized protein n=1 Tax=Roseiarcus fermentans TaxID=1473586 RepID=A0A366FB52_9HYPH|nr:hypothetical protein DFR50_11511 [Roseiarcus fermentans]
MPRFAAAERRSRAAARAPANTRDRERPGARDLREPPPGARKEVVNRGRCGVTSRQEKKWLAGIRAANGATGVDAAG